jgi:hypothetical protein
MKKILKSSLVLSGILLANFSFAQTGINGGNASVTGQTGVVTTTVPFLLISPDARSGGMADVGVAVSPDANAIYWNPAKLAFEPDEMGICIAYTPWLSELVPDISLSSLSMYKTIDKFSGFGASLRYFSLGDITFTDNNNNYLKTFRPNEFAIDGGYARKLSEHFSVGVTGRFIYSDLAGATPLSNGEVTKPAYDFAGDLSAYYTTKVKFKDGTKADLSFGGNITNIGGKITYTDAANRDFIPTNLKVGGYLNVHVNDYNDIGFAVDLNKLLVPTPPIYATDSNGNLEHNPDGTTKILHGRDPNTSPIQGMLQSFYDAPGGFKQEMALIDPAIAIEYWYAHQVSGRIGFFYEDPNEGNRQYMTFGVGLRYSVFNIDFSYLVPTNGGTTTTRSPLENTLRFSLSFNFDKGTLKKAKDNSQIGTDK